MAFVGLPRLPVGITLSNKIVVGFGISSGWVKVSAVASGSQAGIGSDFSKVDLAFGGFLGSLIGSSWPSCSVGYGLVAVGFPSTKWILQTCKKIHRWIVKL